MVAPVGRDGGDQAVQLVPLLLQLLHQALDRPSAELKFVLRLVEPYSNYEKIVKAATLWLEFFLLSFSKKSFLRGQNEK